MVKFPRNCLPLMVCLGHTILNFFQGSSSLKLNLTHTLSGWCFIATFPASFSSPHPKFNQWISLSRTHFPSWSFVTILHRSFTKPFQSRTSLLFQMVSNIAHTSFNDIKCVCESKNPDNVTNFPLAQLQGHYKSSIFNSPSIEGTKKSNRTLRNKTNITVLCSVTRHKRKMTRALVTSLPNVFVTSSLLSRSVYFWDKWGRF